MARQAEWTGYSLAAQAVGDQQIEQARSAVWDYSIGKNELTNLKSTGWSYNATTKVGKGYSTSVLDLPISGNQRRCRYELCDREAFEPDGIAQ